MFSLLLVILLFVWSNEFADSYKVACCSRSFKQFNHPLRLLPQQVEAQTAVQSIEAGDAIPASSLPTLVLCCAVASLCALDRVVMAVSILPMGEQYDYSDSTRGAIAAFFSLGYMAGLLPSGVASATISPKRVLIVGLLAWSFAQMLTPFAASFQDSIAPLLATRALMGCGEAACIPSLQVLAASFVPASKRSSFWGCVSASLSLGTISAYQISPKIIESYGWPATFQIFGFAGVVLSLFWMLFGRDSPKGGLVECNPQLESCQVIGLEEESLLLEKTKPSSVVGLAEIPWGRIVRTKSIWALAAAHSASNIFLYFSLSWLPTYFSYQFNLSTAQAAEVIFNCNSYRV
jgi:ACS family sodium-dependent inorganic phosphate cotransporter